jgi:spore coat polysaccharide biosynthesis predicted glycosyltransferase SpsG
MTNAPPRTLVIRAEANARIGSGHAMRCLALAQAWQDAGGRAVFAMADVGDDFRTRLAAEGIGLRPMTTAAGGGDDANATAAFAADAGAAIVVVDGQAFSADFRRALRAAGQQIVFIDDYGTADDLACDILVNPNYQAPVDLYPRRSARERLLLGTDYALLRREFRCDRPTPWSFDAPARRFLLTFGGTPKIESVAKTLELLKGCDVAAPVVRVTASSPEERLAILGLPTPPGWPPLECAVNPPMLPDWLAWADLTVITAGTTLWECLCTGSPVVSFYRDDYQRRLLENLARVGAARVLGQLGGDGDDAARLTLRETVHDASLRRAMSAAGRGIIDGRGADRVVRAIFTISSR